MNLADANSDTRYVLLIDFIDIAHLEVSAVS